MEAGMDEGLIIDSFDDPNFRERIYDGWMSMRKYYTFDEYCSMNKIPQEQLKSIVQEFDSIIQSQKDEQNK